MGGGETGDSRGCWRQGSQHPGPGCLAKLNTPPVFPGRCRQCSSTLIPGAYRSGPEEGTFVCAEHCARLGPGGRLGAKPGPPPQPKQQQHEEAKEAAEEAKDVEDGSPSPSAATGAAIDAPKAGPETRPQIPTKPRALGRPQEQASPLAGRPTPAPRKASESTAPTPPTPRPRSSLQPENLAEQGGSSGLVNGEQGPSWAGHSLRTVWCSHTRSVHALCRRAPCVGATLFLRGLVHASHCD